LLENKVRGFPQNFNNLEHNDQKIIQRMGIGGNPVAAKYIQKGQHQTGDQAHHEGTPGE